MLALIFFVLRPMMSRRPIVAIAELTGPRELAADAAVPAQITAGGDILDLPAQTVTKIERLRDVIASRTEDSAAVLRAGSNRPRATREHAGS